MLAFLFKLLFTSFCSYLTIFKRYLLIFKSNFLMHTFSFIINQRLPGNLFASLLKPPWWSAFLNTFEKPLA